MTHFSTQLAPLCGRCSVGKLNQIKCILYKAVKLFYRLVCTWVVVLELTSQTTAQYGQCLCAKVLTELEELKEAKSVTLVIIRKMTISERILPTILVQRTVLYWSYRILPVITCIEVSTFYDTTTRKTENTWLQVSQGLCQIFAHSILTTHPSICWEQ